MARPDSHVNSSIPFRDSHNRLVRALEGAPIASAAAGLFTSLALARSGEMWSWGEGPALGHNGGDDNSRQLPKVIEDLPPGFVPHRYRAA